MDEQQIMIAGGTMCGLLLLLVVSVLWLGRQVRQLKQAHQSLSKQIQRGDADLAAICSAAIAVDRRLAGNEAEVELLAEKLSRQQQSPPPSVKNDAPPVLEGYAKAIQMILHGASAEDLVKTCGMTRDEALLLISVNRSKDLSD